MVKFEDAELWDILPDNFKTPEMQAFSHVLKKYMQKLQLYAKRCSMMAAIPELPDEILDLLAIELRSQYYDTKLPRKAKEEIIRNTFDWYKKSGTASVIEEFFSTIFDNGKVEEWFNYGGNPYYFKAFVNISNSEISPEKNKIVKQQIEAYKNKRSWLELISYLIQSKVEVSIHHDSAITYISQYYPRYNIPFLYFDGTWKWSGIYTLDGYEKDKAIEFYPSKLQISGDVKQETKAESRLHTKNEAKETLKTWSSMGIQSEAPATIQTSSKMSVSTESKQIIQHKETLTIEKDLWFLDGTYSLDGTKLLDAEIINHEL